MKKLIPVLCLLAACGVDSSDGKTVNVSTVNFACVVTVKDFDRSSFDKVLEQNPELGNDIQSITETNNSVQVEACNDVLNQISALVNETKGA